MWTHCACSCIPLIDDVFPMILMKKYIMSFVNRKQIRGYPVVSVAYTDQTCYSDGPHKAPYLFLAVARSSYKPPYLIYRSNPDFTTITRWVSSHEMPDDEDGYGN